MAWHVVHLLSFDLQLLLVGWSKATSKCYWGVNRIDYSSRQESCCVFLDERLDYLVWEPCGLREKAGALSQR